jgi:hypothetical protein
MRDIPMIAIICASQTRYRLRFHASTSRSSAAVFLDGRLNSSERRVRVRVGVRVRKERE